MPRRETKLFSLADFWLQFLRQALEPLLSVVVKASQGRELNTSSPDSSNGNSYTYRVFHCLDRIDP